MGLGERRVCILPSEFAGDKGGIVRIVDGLRAHLPKCGWEVVNEELGADIVHCIATARPRHGRVDVYTNQGVIASPRISIEEQIMETIQWLAREAAIVTFPSSYSRSVFPFPLPRGYTVIPNGIEFGTWRRLDRVKYNYILWGKVSCENEMGRDGVEWALEVARLCPDLRFKFTCAPGTVLPNVDVCGPMPYEEMRKVIMGAKAYLLTTAEPFGIQTLEALACGLPIVGRAVGANPEVIRNGVNGWLYGTPAEAAQVLTSIMASEASYFAVNRLRAMDYDWSVIVQRYAKLYEVIM